MERTIFSSHVVASISIACILYLTPFAAHAAELVLSPSDRNYTVGDTFSFTVYVDSVDRAMNAVSGSISFPSDKMKVLSVSKTASLFDLWVQEPSFSNTSGTVSFEGIVLNPGFQGRNGHLLRVTARATAVGSVPIRFSQSSVLANDGLGTNILSDVSGASYIFSGESPAVPVSSTPSTAGGPGAPDVVSSTHPDPSKWYAVRTATFSWNLSSNVDKVRLLVDDSSRSTPSVVYTPPIDTKEVPDMEDGEWYMHVQFHDTSGWGSVGHTRFRIDTQPPTSLSITPVETSDPTSPTRAFVFDAEDTMSGIDHYDIIINGDVTEMWVNDGSNIYETPALPPGDYIMIVRATDAAGNSISRSAEFSIDSLETPRITEYTRQLIEGEFLVVKGETLYPGGTTEVFVQQGNRDVVSYRVTNDESGNFVFVAEKRAEQGLCTIWAEVIDTRGARSMPSGRVTVAVEQTALMKFGNRAIHVMAVLVPLVVLVLALIALLYYAWHRFILWRAALRREVSEAEDALKKAFALLVEDLEEQRSVLEKARKSRKLTKEESLVMRRMKKNLKDAHEYIQKELKDITRAVK